MQICPDLIREEISLNKFITKFDKKELFVIAGRKKEEVFDCTDCAHSRGPYNKYYSRFIKLIFNLK